MVIKSLTLNNCINVIMACISMIFNIITIFDIQYLLYRTHTKCHHFMLKKFLLLYT